MGDAYCACGRGPVWMSDHSTWCPAYTLTETERREYFQNKLRALEGYPEAQLDKTSEEGKV